MCSQMPFIRVLYGATVSVHGVLLSRVPVRYRSGTGPVSLFPTGATLLLSPVLVRYRSGTGLVPVWFTVSHWGHAFVESGTGPVSVRYRSGITVSHWGHAFIESGTGHPIWGFKNLKG